MNIFRKSCALILCCAILGSILGGCADKSAQPSESVSVPATESFGETLAPAISEETEKPDEELNRAVSAGLMPEEWLSRLDETIQFHEYTAVLTKVVELWDPEYVPQWQEITALAADAQEPMRREDGLLMLSYLWIMMGKGSEHVFGYLDEAVNPDVYRPQEFVDAQWSLLSWNYPYFPDWETTVYEIYNSNYMAGAVNAFLDVMSPVSGEFVISRDDISWDDVTSLRMQEDLTYEDAVKMAVRIAEYCKIDLSGIQNQYTAVSEIGTYNKDIITDDILSKNTDLPEVVQSALPSAWNGAGIAARKAQNEQYLHFAESDIVFLHENGFNFTRLFFDFQTLRYPEYPADPCMVNQKELEELDQLLAWCMEYDVHLQISMRGYLSEDGVNIQFMPENDASWELVQSYWTMLARRYADIPSQYLSFDLSNEIEPDHREIDAQKAKLAEMVAAIREADSDRVLLYSQASKGNIAWTEAVASLGIAIGCHPYAPNFIATADKFYCQQNPYAEVTWPLPYFPMGNAMEGSAPIEISGDIGGAEMGIHLWNSGQSPVLSVYADDALIERINPEGTLGEGDEYYYFDTIYTVQIPEGAEVVTIKVEGDYARIDTIVFEKNGVKTTIMPSDTCDYPDYTDPLPLVVTGDGTYTNSENSMFDAERIYQTVIEPYQNIAEQYGVGFMVNEFGMFGTNVYWDIDAVVAFHETYLELLESKDIPWCCCEIFNVFPKHLIVLYGEESQWTGATEVDISYTLLDGSTVTIKVCKELLDLFRAYTAES